MKKGVLLQSYYEIYVEKNELCIFLKIFRSLRISSVEIFSYFACEKKITKQKSVELNKVFRKKWIWLGIGAIFVQPG